MENEQILRSHASSCKGKKGSTESCEPKLNTIDSDGEWSPLHKHQKCLSTMDHQRR